MNAAGTKPSSIPRHLAANAVGRVWVLLANFLFVPVYLHLLGIENFGVIALFTAVGGLIAFLDMGLSPTLARELHDHRRGTAERASLLYTYELAYAALVGLMVLLAATVPASWFALVLSAEDLARPEVHGAIRLVFAAAAAQLLLNFYVAGLLGVEEQVRGNAVLVAAGIVRSAVVIVPLWFYPTPAVYLSWQLASVLLFAVFARAWLYRAVRGGASVRRRFDFDLIWQNSAFTGAMFLVSVTAAVNTQVDKLFIGRLEGLESLGAYSLVSTFAQLLVFLVSPITITLLPRFVRAAAAGDQSSIRELFVLTHRVVAGVVCAAFAAMLFFGPYLISLWTLGQLDAASIQGYAPALIGGYALLALGTVPHCVAVANKNLNGSLAIAGSVVLTVPAYWFLTRRFGPAGAAATWLALQAVVVPAYIAWVDRRFLRIPRPGRLLFSTVVLPLAVALIVCFLGRLLLGDTSHVLRNLGVIVAAVIVSTAACLSITLRRADRAFLAGSWAS